MSETPPREGAPEEDPASAPAVAGSGAVPPSQPSAARTAAWRELLGFLPDVARLLADVSRDPRVPLRDKVMAGAAAAYLVSPLDVIPDAIPVIGQMDDAALALWAVRRLVRGAGYDVLKDLWRGTDDGFALLLLIAGIER
ncbi:MAG: YkvA family protein [Nitriliruptorales bacterium]